MRLIPDDLQYIYRLKNITRYNSRTKISTESVAEHSFFVTLLALELCDQYELSDELKLQVLIKAILHDMPEIELNDITYDVKEKLNLRPILKQYEDNFFNNNFKKYSELMNKCNDAVVQTIVDYADALSVYQYVEHEILIGNNSSDIHKIKSETHDRLVQYKNKLIILLDKGGN